jgi:hypothetical protein
MINRIVHHADVLVVKAPAIDAAAEASTPAQHQNSAPGN